MPVTETVHDDIRLVHTVATGVLTRDDFIDHIKRTWRGNAISDYDEIVDATAADASHLTADDLLAIVNSGVEFDPDDMPKLALCVSSDLAYGIGRMFSSMREVHDKNAREIQVFRNLAEAEAWLGKRGR